VPVSELRTLVIDIVFGELGLAERSILLVRESREAPDREAPGEAGSPAKGDPASLEAWAQPPAIDAVLQAAVACGDVPGVVAIATDRKGVVYRGAFGVAEGAAAKPMRPDSIFRIASMTKAITSVAAMQLIEQGRIGLEDPAAKYLPAFSQASVLTSFDPKTGDYASAAAATPVTVRQLLTHTSGLGYTFTSPIVRDFKPKNGDEFAVGPLLFQPGERWLYSTATDWVGRLVETVSGQTLEAYFNQHVLGPLKMTSTFFNVPGAQQARLVNFWRRDENGALAEQPREAPSPVTRFNGGGGLSSSADDYIRFLQMLLNDGAGGGMRILSADSVAAMGRNQIGDVNARAVQTAQPALSRDFTFIHDGRDKWGLGFLITTDAVPGIRSAGT
jgi:CubicO group peptidase (beta-lactamase class C family)